MKSLLVIGSISWLVGLVSVLTTSFFRFETPGMADVLGFGSYLLFGTAVLITICYLPFIRTLKNRNHFRRYFLFVPWMLALVINAPMYFVVWQGSYFTSEAYLFTLGFFVIGFSFTTGYLWSEFEVSGKYLRTVYAILILVIILLFTLFDYQVLYGGE